jgi:hypothetical protein
MEEYYREVNEFRHPTNLSRADLAADQRAAEEAYRQQHDVLTSITSACPRSGDYSSSFYVWSPAVDAAQLLNGETNYAKLQGMSCLANAVLMTYNEEDKNVVEAESIRRQLTGITRIGDPSAFGYAMSAGIDGVERAFVLKVANRESLEMYHEAYIGLVAANKFRREGRPNWSAVYGYFMCSAPIIGDDGKVIEYCAPGSTHQVPYCVYEYVPGIPLNKYVLTASAAELTAVYLQLILALRDSNFTHWDLHSGNVICRNTGATQIKYSHSDADYYVRSNTVATMIDYGQSVYQPKNGIDGGTYERHAWSATRLRDGIFPAYDAYKLLMFMAVAYRGKEAENINRIMRLNQIFQFFFPGVAIMDAVHLDYDDKNYRYRTGYALPPTNKYLNLTLRDLTAHILEFCSGGEVCQLDVNFDNIPMLSQNGTLTLARVAQQAGVHRTQLRVPKTIFEFFDLYGYVSTRRKEILPDLLRAFDYDTAKQIYNTELSVLKDRLETYVHAEFDLKNLASTKTTYDNLFHYANLLETVVMYLKVGQKVDMLLNRASFNTTQYEQLVAKYRTELCGDVWHAIRTFHQAVRAGLDDWYVSALQNLRYLRTDGCNNDRLFNYQNNYRVEGNFKPRHEERMAHYRNYYLQ